MHRSRLVDFTLDMISPSLCIRDFRQVDLRHRGQKGKAVNDSSGHDEAEVAAGEPDESPADDRQKARDDDDLLAADGSGQVTGHD